MVLPQRCAAALDIEAQPKRRLADEYDAVQRGAKSGRAPIISFFQSRRSRALPTSGFQIMRSTKPARSGRREARPGGILSRGRWDAVVSAEGVFPFARPVRCLFYSGGRPFDMQDRSAVAADNEDATVFRDGTGKLQLHFVMARHNHAVTDAGAIDVIAFADPAQDAERDLAKRLDPFGALGFRHRLNPGEATDFLNEARKVFGSVVKQVFGAAR